MDTRYKLSFTLPNLVACLPEMSFYDEESGMFQYRYCSKKELDRIVWEGREFRFPIAWCCEKGTTYETHSITDELWDKGERWTLRKVLKMMRMIYSTKKNVNLYAMGDHVFFEGFSGNTYYPGS